MGIDLFQLVVIPLVGTIAVIVLLVLLIRATERTRTLSRSRRMNQQLSDFLEDAALSSSYHVDAAISDLERDELNRLPFVTRIIDMLARLPLASSATVAIDGAWGSGKTSVVNLLEQRLRKDELYLVVRFDPWAVARHSDVPAQLFLALAAAVLLEAPSNKIDQTYRRLARQFMRIAEALQQREAVTSSSFAARLSAMLPAAKSLPASPIDAARLHSVASRSAMTVGRRLVVLVDDLDRLLPQEQLDFVRLIGTLGQVGSTAYILAMDYPRVNQNIVSLLANDDSKYLDKVVQLPIALPAATRDQLDAMLFSRLTAVYGDWANIRTTRYFSSIYTDALRFVIRTPRDAKRVALAYEALTVEIGTELNPVDLLALAVIQATYPGLYRMIPLLREALIGPAFLFGTVNVQDANAVKMMITNNASTLDINALEQGFEHLFPFLSNSMRGQETRNSARFAWRRERRIAEPEHFDLAFGETDTEHSVSHREIAAFFRGADDRNALEAALVRISSSEKATAFLIRLQDDVSQIPESLVAPLIDALLDLGDLFPETRSGPEAALADSSLRISWIVGDLLDRLGDKGYLNHAIEWADQSIYVPSVAFSIIGTEKSEGNSARGVLPGFGLSANLLARRIEERFATGTLFNDPRITVRGGVSFLIFRWVDWTSQDHVRKVLSEGFRDDALFYAFIRSAILPYRGPLLTDVSRAYKSLMGDNYLKERLGAFVNSDYAATLFPGESERIREFVPEL